MPRFAYVNGSYLPHDSASVHIQDRGFQFADGVYEVVYLYKGQMIDADPHLARLQRSLDELQMAVPMSMKALKLVMKELVRKNRVKTGMLYLQVTRGTSERDFPFPKDCLPTVVMTTTRLAPYNLAQVEKGLKIMSLEDIRWKRCDIKTVGLLGAAWTKQIALDQGFDDAWMLDAEGKVTEGTSNNAWIIRDDGNLQTRPPSHEILNGITRRAVLACAEREGVKVIEAPFLLEEAKHAREAFVTSATACVKPVHSIDGHPVGDGKTGPMTRKMAKLYLEHLNHVVS